MMTSGTKCLMQRRAFDASRMDLDMSEKSSPVSDSQGTSLWQSHVGSSYTTACCRSGRAAEKRVSRSRERLANRNNGLSGGHQLPAKWLCTRGCCEIEIPRRKLEV